MHTKFKARENIAIINKKRGGKMFEKRVFGKDMKRARERGTEKQHGNRHSQ